MTFLKKAKEIAKVIISDENDVETENTYLYPFLTMTLSDIVKKWVKDGKKLARKLNVKTVYYPGMALDILRPFIYTDCDTLIACDLPDELFYPILGKFKKASKRFKSQTELFYIADALATHLKVLEEYLDYDEEQEIKNIEIGESEMTIHFTLFGKPRTLFVHIGNADTFIPAEHPDMIFNSAFTLQSNQMAKIAPKYVLIPDQEENSFLAKKELYLTTELFYFRLFDTNLDIFVGLDKEMADKNSPLFIMKAHLLFDITKHQKVNIYNA